MTLKLKEWSLKVCMMDAKPFNTRSAWKKEHPAAYQQARTNGWLEECCKHMQTVRRRRTLEDCQKEASPFSTRSQWRYNNYASYHKAHKEGWLDLCCSHMEKARTAA
jgi:hypothetical protein